MQSIMLNAKANINNQGNGIITIMIRDISMAVAEDRTQLDSFEVNILGQDEAQIQKIERNSI